MSICVAVGNVQGVTYECYGAISYHQYYDIMDFFCLSEKLSEYISDSNSQVFDGTDQEMLIAPYFRDSENCPNFSDKLNIPFQNQIHK